MTYIKPSIDDIRSIIPIFDEDKQYQTKGGKDRNQFSLEIEEFVKDLLTKAYALYEAREEHGLLFKEGDTFIVVRGFSTQKQAEEWGLKAGLEPGQAVHPVIKTPEEV